ncbi:MAG: DUF4397 domain-containing protein [Myxococcota bacterium]
MKRNPFDLILPSIAPLVAFLMLVGSVNCSSSDASDDADDDPIVGTYEGVARGDFGTSGVVLEVQPLATAGLSVGFNLAHAQAAAYVVSLQLFGQTFSGDLTNGTLTVSGPGGLSCTGTLAADGAISGQCAGYPSDVVFQVVQRATGGSIVTYCGATDDGRPLALLVTARELVVVFIDGNPFLGGILGDRLQFFYENVEFLGTIDAQRNVTPTSPNWTLGACTMPTPVPGPGGNGGAGGDGMGGMGGAGAGGSGGGPTGSTSRLRIVHGAFDYGALDFCFRDGGMLVGGGPLLQSNGDADGLAYLDVQGYATLPAGNLTLEIHDGNSGDCSGPPLLVENNLPLAAGAEQTLVVATFLGQPMPTIELGYYPDNDTQSPSPGHFRLRVAHLMSGAGTVAVGYDLQPNFQLDAGEVWFTNLPYKQLASPPYVDVMPPGSGFFRIEPTTNSASQWPGAPYTTVSFAPGGKYSAFAVGNASVELIRLLVCVDGDGTGSNCQSYIGG